jgi:hypothetical protein
MERNMTEERTKYTGFQLTGMKCWKCKKEMGALQIPSSDPLTPELLSAYLISHEILPVCDSCIKVNPRFVAFENLPK